MTRDVPPYGIVAGVPARLVRMRFDTSVIEMIEASRWWERDIAPLLDNLGGEGPPQEPYCLQEMALQNSSKDIRRTGCPEPSRDEDAVFNK